MDLVEAGPALRPEEAQAALALLEAAALESLHRELAVHPGCELGAADEPRVRDILARLTHELARHLEGEWHIAETARHASRDVLPPPELFQPPHWRPAMDFDFGASKTSFLGAEVAGRFVATRYVSRGAMGRVWVVEDRLSSQAFPLCLKTFYCACECEELGNLSAREFQRGVLQELSQVERWMTSRTRLAVSRHLVRVVRVLRDAPVVRTVGGARVEATINGILMEFCDRGELTSYLWDEKRHKPRAFDEATGQFLFAQLMDLLVELFAPPPVAATGGPSCTHESEDTAGASIPLAATIERDTSVGGMSQLSVVSDASGRDEPESWEVRALVGLPQPIKYFHSDIKTENLVISGTTLKLIDFQSLAPLRGSRCGRPAHVEHATVEYQHRHGGALAAGLEARAEGTALWACGVILVRLLAAELPSDWVYRHRGLGPQGALEPLLPPGHCLLRAGEPGGPRALLERLFSPEATPSLQEMLAHPWVAGARGGREASAPAAAKRALEELRPRACDPRQDLVAWIALTGCVCVEGKPPPSHEAEELISAAMSLSDGHFRLDGRRHRSHTRSACEDRDAVEESFHEWHIIVCDAEEEEAAQAGDFWPPSLQPAPRTGPADAGPSPSSGAAGTSWPGTPRSPASARRSAMWQSLRTRLVLDRFCVQLRAKEDLAEDEPSGIWWLRVKWLPPMVAGKKDTLGGLTMGRHRADSKLGLVECGSFVMLQQLLLEGRNEVVQRTERAAAQSRRPATPGGTTLPILGR